MRLVMLLLFIGLATPLNGQQLANPRDIDAWNEDHGAMAFSVDGQQIYTGSDNHAIQVWDAATGDAVRRFPLADRVGVWGLDVSRDGGMLAAACSSSTENTWVELFALPNGEPLRRLVGFDGLVVSVTFTDDGKHLITWDAKRKLKWWDASTGELIQSETVKGWRPVTDDTRQLLAFKTAEGGVAIWSVPDRRELRTLRLPAATSTAALSSGGRWLATSRGWRDTAIRLWDARNGEPMATLDDGRKDRVYSLAFSPDGNLLAAAELNGGMTLWDTARAERIARYRVGIAGGVVFSSDGKQLARYYGISDSSGGIRVWDVVAQ